MNITKNKNWYRIKSFIPKQLFEPLLYFYYGVQSIGYFGNNYYCPICKSKLRIFKSGNCPNCGADIRHRTLWLFLLRKTDFFKSRLDVLHFAPEHCFYNKMKKQQNINYLSADLRSPRAMIEIDITNIKYPDNFFNVLISSHVLEHVDDDLKAMKELHRVQSIDGWSIHLVPIDYSRNDTYENSLIKSPEERMKVYGHHDHKRIYGKDYKNKLESSGFKVTVFKTEDFCEENEIAKMGLHKDTEIYYCRK
ncbi:MAG: methyltransferase domain-containing protein [Bacteroidota bacterium]|nr:methyltransferase domain-containing protein [Bacteroidota bacterium]